jgi:hypothetical protein
MLRSGGEAALFGIARGAHHPPGFRAVFRAGGSPAPFGTSITLDLDPALRELHLDTVGTGQVSGADRYLLHAEPFRISAIFSLQAMLRCTSNFSYTAGAFF